MRPFSVIDTATGKIIARNLTLQQAQHLRNARPTRLVTTDLLDDRSQIESYTDESGETIVYEVGPSGVRSIEPAA